MVLFIALIRPFLITRLADFYGDKKAKRSEGIRLAIYFALLSLLSSIMLNLYFIFVNISIAKAKQMLMYIIYRKSLTVSQSSSSKYSTTGKKVNMMSTDALTISSWVAMFPGISANLLFIFVILAALVLTVGVSGLAGWGLTILSFPLQVILGRKIGNARRKMNTSSDERLKFISELLMGIRVTKLYSWELALMDKVFEYRTEEMKRLFLKIKYGAFNTSFGYVIPPLVALVTFTTYVALGNKLEIGTVFAVVTLVSLLRVSLRLLPVAAMVFIQGRIGLERINAFLKLDDINDANKMLASPDTNANNKLDLNTVIYMNNATFRWVEDTKKLKNNDIFVNGKKLLDSPRSPNTPDLPNNTKITKPEHTIIEMKENVDKEESEENESKLKENFELYKLNLNIKAGELIAIIGSVGSGKSSLLSSVLCEMTLINGESKIYLNNSKFISYCSQQAFIVNATLRENILMGLPYKRRQYQKCILSSALLQDINILSNGDLTEIGERGINLSGGQKSRIQFARALYRYELTDIFLFDDPLSAVDNHVGNIMWNEGILKVLNEKTRLIIMNSHLHLLKSCDRILVLDNGIIAFNGSYEQVLKNDKYQQLLPDNDEEIKKTTVKTKENKLAIKQWALNEKKNREKNKTKLDRLKRGLSDMDDKSGRNMESGKLIQEEKREKGGVDKQLYVKYFNNAAVRFDWYLKNENEGDSKIGNESSTFGILMIIFLFILIVLTQLCQSGGDIWMSLFSSDSEKSETPDKQRFPNKSKWWWISIWGSFVVSLGLFGFLTSYVFGSISTRSSVNLHMRVLYNVLRAPVLYFDSTPVGRILNRFGSDTSVMDNDLPTNFNTFLANFMLLVGYFVIICVTLPYIIIVMLLIIPAFYYLQKFFRRASRAVKRLEAISKSPIYSLFTETLGGLETIRAFGLTHAFLLKYKLHLSNHTKVWLQVQLNNRWFALYLDLLVSIIVVSVALLGVWLKNDINTALLTLSVVYAQGFSQLLQWTIRSSVDVENNFTSIERLLQYEKQVLDTNGSFFVDKKLDDIKKYGIPKENIAVNKDYRPPKSWPEKGEIVFTNLKLRYRKDLDLVLKGINCTIKPGEKIGICGRTGAGKSSLLVTLFRLVEPETDSSIVIDGIDCLKLGLRDLRSNLSIIPQDPVLFSGSIRFNLDPFNNVSDTNIWDILDKIKLKELIKSKNSGLNYLVTEGGSNFSQGEKQLICIGRALLKKSKILLLDEATSSIDKHSDELIQKLIRKYFNGITVLTIAHRLETIIDYDRIMVLDKGNIVEFDTPKNLVEIKDGIFASMVNSKNIKIDPLNNLDEIDVNEVIDNDISNVL